MTSAANKVGMLVILVAMTPVAGWGANTSAGRNTSPATQADAGETTAAEYRVAHSICSSVLQYGNQVRPIGQVTGDPEKDTVAYPVERVQSDCPNGQK